MTLPLRDLDLETLAVEEFTRRCALPVTDEAIETTRELVTWFLRAYPTAKERFAYVRRVRARVLPLTSARVPAPPSAPLR